MFHAISTSVCPSARFPINEIRDKEETGHQREAFITV
jgi:hypothetical protein